MANKEKLGFYWKGEGWTNTIRDFIREGAYHLALVMLQDLPTEAIYPTFNMEYKAVGDTRDDSMRLEAEKPENHMTDDNLYWSIRNLITKVDIEIWHFLNLDEKIEELKSNFKKTREEIKNDHLTFDEREDALEILLQWGIGKDRT